MPCGLLILVIAHQSLSCCPQVSNSISSCVPICTPRVSLVCTTWRWKVLCSETGLQSMQMGSCTTSSSSSSLATGPSQNWLQTVNYLSQLLLYSFPANQFDLLSVYTPSASTSSRQICSSADTEILHITHVRTKTFWPTLFLLLFNKAMDYFPFWQSDIHLIQSP